MKLCSHLKISRHGIYYFRYIIPKVLRPLYNGKTELKYSLHTRNPMTAKREAYILSAKTSHIFHKTKQTMAIYNPNDFNIDDLVNSLKSSGKSSTYEMTFADGSSIKTDPNNPRDHQDAMEMAKLKFGYDALNLSQKPVAIAAPVSSALKLSVAINKYLDIRAVDAPNAKTMIEIRGSLQRFLSWTHEPNDPTVDTISKKMMSNYLHHLLTKAENKKTKTLGLSKNTANKQISFLHGLFVKLQEWDEISEFFPVPTDGVSPFARGEKKKTTEKNAYEAFTLKEISIIFNPTTIHALTKPHEFWLPLLALYSGARINELSQPYIDDFNCEDGLWRLSIHGKRGNRIKTESSERNVPLHPDLIALGFLDYLDDVREVSPEGRIFPYLLDNPLNGFGDVPSESFGRYLGSLEIDSTKKVFHSFRHTLNQHLIGKSVPKSDREELLGHAVSGTNDEHYGRTKTAEELWKDVVSKIAFPQITNKLDTLRYTKGKFTPILKAELARRNKQLNHKVAKKTREATALNAKNKGKQ